MLRTEVLRLLARIIGLLLICAVCTLFAAVFAAKFVSHQLAGIVQANREQAIDLGAPLKDPVVEIDFYQATGISEKELASYLEDYYQRENIHVFPVLLTLQNERGDYLANGSLIARWNGGEHRFLIGKSAVVRLPIQKHKLPGLTIVAPDGYSVLRQKSIPLGIAYEPEQKLDTSNLEYHVQYDGEIQHKVASELLRIRADGNVLSYEQISDQLRRRNCALDLPTHSSTELTNEEIYQLRKNSVVIIANLYSSGGNTQATGFVLAPSGVIVTAYHAIDKPTAVSRGVLTADGKMYAIEEVLAADKSADVAIVKIAAGVLQSAPLSDGDVTGATVTVISHPLSRYFTLTEGRISRYWAGTVYGRVVVKMAITAEFADGSSGAPIFNSRGAVTGIVNATEVLGNQMVYRVAAPADAIRQLIRSSDDDTT